MFENRETGEVTIAQFPNWPLWGVAGTWAVGLLAGSDSDLGRASSWTRVGLWVIWGGDELLRGVNPWRRFLGAGVLAWQAIALASGR